jgi:hypothetical protein
MNRRRLIGWIAVGLLAVGGWRLTISTTDALAAACLRIGMLMFAVWLAYRDLEKIPPWLFVSSLCGLAVVMWRPALAVLVVPALCAFWLLRPRSR